MIIFLHGPDTFRSRRKLHELREQFNKTGPNAGLNTAILAGDGLDPAAFERAITTVPFLSNKRLVIVEQLLEKNRGKKIIDTVLGLLPRVDQQTTVLIFWEPDVAARRDSGRTAAADRELLSVLQKADRVQEFKLLDPAAVGQWIHTEVAGHGAIFKLPDALGRRQKAVALQLITDQLRSGTSPTQLLSTITWQFRNLLLVKLLLNERGSAAAELGGQLGLHPFVVRKTSQQAGYYQLEDLKKIYSRLSSIEHKIKTSQVAPEVLLDLLGVAS